MYCEQKDRSKDVGLSLCDDVGRHGFNIVVFPLPLLTRFLKESRSNIKAAGIVVSVELLMLLLSEPVMPSSVMIVMSSGIHKDDDDDKLLAPI